MNIQQLSDYLESKGVEHKIVTASGEIHVVAAHQTATAASSRLPAVVPDIEQNERATLGQQVTYPEDPTRPSYVIVLRNFRFKNNDRANVFNLFGLNRTVSEMHYLDKYGSFHYRTSRVAGVLPVFPREPLLVFNVEEDGLTTVNHSFPHGEPLTVTILYNIALSKVFHPSKFLQILKTVAVFEDVSDRVNMPNRKARVPNTRILVSEFETALRKAVEDPKLINQKAKQKYMKLGEHGIAGPMEPDTLESFIDISRREVIMDLLKNSQKTSIEELNERVKSLMDAKIKDHIKWLNSMG